MARIVINIDMEELASGINQVVDDDYEEDFACPLVTHDKETNEDHKQYAVDEFSYGPATKNWEKTQTRYQVSKVNQAEEGLN